MNYLPDFFSVTPAHSVNHSPLTETQLLKSLSRKGLSKILSSVSAAAPISDYNSRLESELGIIDEKSLSSYFLIVSDYVQWAKDNGIAVGPGRGSGPCSLVGFALGITSIDPIKYRLPFERFFNPHRQVFPDFDIDFCESRRDEVTDYIQRKYKANHVAQISSESSTPLPSRLVICDRPLAVIAPVYPNPDTGVQATTLTLAKLADTGLVQFNVINQKALTINQQMTDALGIENISAEAGFAGLNDESAYKLLCNGEKSNISYLDENGHYLQALKSVQPRKFEDLYATVALSHPPVHKFLPEFLKRKHNPDNVSDCHPAIEAITYDTYGLVIYQEQIMNVLHDLADFSFAEADSFRRALLRSDTDAVTRYEVEFIRGARKHGLTEQEASAIFGTFAIPGERYFNKSHAVAFATIAYQTAWLKARFLTTYNSNGNG